MSVLQPLFEKHAGLVPTVSPAVLERLEKHLELLTVWNEQMSLVSRNSLLNAFAVHYVDSLFISEFAEKHRGDRPIYELGSGAGFPGLVYAMRYPEVPISMFEKSLKKQSFLTAATSSIPVSNASIQGAFPESRLSGLFLARAVFPRDELFPFFRKHLEPGSRLITNLGGQGEIPDSPPDFPRLDQHLYTLPLDCGNRRVELLEFVPRGTKN